MEINKLNPHDLAYNHAVYNALLDIYARIPEAINDAIWDYHENKIENDLFKTMEVLGGLYWEAFVKEHIEDNF